MNHTEKSDSTIIVGTPAAKGLAVGKVHLLCHTEVHLSDEKISPSEVDKEEKRIEFAVDKLKQELQLTRRIASSQKQAEVELIIETQLQILDDPELKEHITFHLKEKLLKADRAVWDSFQFFIEILEQSRNNYMMERVPDIKEVRNRLVRIILQGSENIDINEDSIVVSDEITPSEVVYASKKNVKGIVSDRGGLTSHSAIIAHSLGIPMLIGAKNSTKRVKDNDTVIVDADVGRFYLAPDQLLIDNYCKTIEKQKTARKKLLKILDEPDVMLCGTPFRLLANIELYEEIDQIKKYRAKGVGLLRTEALLMQQKNGESPDYQVDYYRSILKDTVGEVTIRLFDIGGDKLIGPMAVESNPFLGWRGVRVLLDRLDLLKDQYSAILQASAGFSGRVRILVPMVSWLEEWFAVRKYFEETKEDLRNKGIPFDENIPLGAMVEVPSMIVQADKFAKYVDFMSIGTNDLTQYILAVDRGNTLISHLYQQIHPSIFRAVSYAVRAANSKQIEVAVCGESASDPLAAMAYLGLGIHTLSMTPNEIPKVKAKLRSTTYQACRKMAKQLHDAETLGDVEAIIQQK